jgi:RHS repeat-associated protein
MGHPVRQRDPEDSITSQTTRGFTNQEELGVSSLVHLNGRIYDPLLGRMTSADPTVPDPLNVQAWNRYSYVGNDPLTFTDPNGHVAPRTGPFLFAGTYMLAVTVCAGRGHLGIRWTSLFWATASLFSPTKFPVRFRRETPRKTLGYRDIQGNAGAAMASVSRISLYFSLLAGNLGRRLVRTGLRRQPAKNDF